MSFFFRSLSFSCLALPTFSLAEAKGVVLQAEAHMSSGAQVISDATCSGGGYARQMQGGYVPVVTVPVPETLASGSQEVWVRRRGGAVQMKRRVGAHQQPEPWCYSQETEFIWQRLGRWPGEELGSALVFIGGAKAEPAAELDAIYITPETASAADLDALLPALPEVPLSIAWDQPQRSLTADAFGLNGFAAVNPDTTANERYLANLAHMRPGFLRVHHADLMEDSRKTKGAGWLHHGTRAWDAARMLAALKPLREAGHRLMPCIPHWPDWMDADDDKRLDADQYDAFARLCAELVRMVNAEESGLLPILDWEITNELDERYHQRFHEAKEPDHLADMVRLYQTVAHAMKKADPRIRTGGPSAMNSYNFDFHQRFITACAADLDFYSTHLYVSGKSGESDSLIFQKASGPQFPIRRLRAYLDEASPRRHIPLYVNEFNISYDWRQGDRRMTTGFGAVWDAWFILTALEVGAEATAAWNECDGTFGKTTPKHERRLGAEAYHWWTQHLIGTQVRATLPDADAAQIKACAVMAKGQKRLLVVNRGARPRTVRLSEPGAGTLHTMLCMEAGTAAHSGELLRVPGQSFVLLVW
jgi:hypothetical protein